MVGGGYGTGREIVEYFTRFGFTGGLMGLGVAFVALAAVLALTYEFARLNGAYDYRNFFKRLFGRFWVAFEILIILQFLIVLAVLASASGNILRDNFDLPYGVGLLIMLAVVGVLTFHGRELIARTLTYWSFLLYAVFITFFILVMIRFGDGFIDQAARVGVIEGWARGGLEYALYNVAGAPLLLYVARSFETRREAVTSGIVAGAIALVPALLFQVAFFTAWPDVLDQAIPVYWMMNNAGMTVLLVVYSVMLFGTFIETGAGMLHGINERLDAWLIESRGQGLSSRTHAAIAVCAIIVCSILSLWGITNLIARGYGTMAWGFFVVYLVPIATIGLYRICRPTVRLDS
jgi:uncharacterized membrane protein YkvI